MQTYLPHENGYMDHQIKLRLQSVLDIPLWRVEEFLSICKRVIHQKNDLIDAGGRVFDQLGYIVDGAARIFYLNDNGEEMSYLLQVNGDALGDYESYLTGQPSQVKIEFLLPTEVLYFRKKDIDRLAERDVFWLALTKRISDLAFIYCKRRLDELFFYTPEQRYLNLSSKSPEILNKIPQKYISTYLGITPQSLSRIRKRLAEVDLLT